MRILLINVRIQLEKILPGRLEWWTSVVIGETSFRQVAQCVFISKSLPTNLFHQLLAFPTAGSDCPTIHLSPPVHLSIMVRVDRERRTLSIKYQHLEQTK